MLGDAIIVGDNEDGTNAKSLSRLTEGLAPLNTESRGQDIDKTQSPKGSTSMETVKREKYGISSAPYATDDTSEGDNDNHAYRQISNNYEPMEMESESDIGGLLDTLNSYDIGEADYGFFPVTNLDEFFEKLYAYYKDGGFACILAERLTSVTTLGFTVLFSTFLLGCLNWGRLLECHGEDSCKDFNYYLVRYNDHSRSFAMFVVLYFLFLSTYWLWAVISLFPALKASWEMRQFYFKQLNITTRDLQTMKWSTVIERLVELQDTGRYRIQINGDTLNAKNIAQRIMRKENYMIAMVNHEILPIGSEFYGNSWFLGKILEKMIEICILDQLFNDRFILKREFVNQPHRLRRRFRLFGIVSFLLLPFSLGFMFIYFFLKYAQEFHLKQNYLGPRGWSPHSLWQFREFNELEHFFERRTRASMKHADAYIKQFPTPIPTTIASGISFISGSFLGVLLLFTLLDEAIVFHIKFLGRDLVWYVAILTGILAVARTLVPPVEDTVFNPSAAMRRLVAYTHHLPGKWRNKAHTYDCRDEFSQLFQYKVVLLLREITCILSTPYILFFVLPHEADRIIEFVSSHTAFVKGVGDVCIFSELDIQTHGDPLYGGMNLKGFQAKDGKLEKSWLNFNTNYNIHNNPTRNSGEDVDGGSEAKDETSNLHKRLVEFQQQKVGSSNADAISVPNMNMVSALNMTNSITDADIANFMHSDLPSGSISSDKGMFESNHAAAIPLDKIEFENQENYFYWLEEYRDSREKELP